MITENRFTPLCLLGNINMESSDAWLWLFLRKLSGSYSFSRLSHLHAVNFVLLCLADVVETNDWGFIETEQCLFQVLLTKTFREIILSPDFIPFSRDLHDVDFVVCLAEVEVIETDNGGELTEIGQ